MYIEGNSIDPRRGNLSKVKYTRQDLISAYDVGGSVDKAAYLVGISPKLFGKLWNDLVGITPPRSAKKTRPRKNRLEDEEIHKIAFISDLHFGSKYQCLDELNDFIRTTKRREVKTLVCLGDLSDGLGMHDDMAAEQFLHKPKDIVSYIVDNYPGGFDTNVFITGNHDFSLQKHGCVDIGQAVAEERDDLVYLGHDCGMVTLGGGLELYAYHGTNGCADVRSKRTQDLAMKLAFSRSGVVPHVMATGHCHTEHVIPSFLGMLVMGLGCFQRQTPYLETRGLYPDISGMILSYQVINSKLTNPSIEFIRYDR